MMTETDAYEKSRIENFDTDRTEFEVALAALKPQVRQDSLINAQKEGLLLLCRNSISNKRAEFDLRLAETIVQTGSQEITVSLRQYVRSVRNSALLFGLLLGTLLGGVIMFAVNEHSNSTKSGQSASAQYELTVPSVTRFPINSDADYREYDSSPSK